jgi:hypothetical protein
MRGVGAPVACALLDPYAVPLVPVHGVAAVDYLPGGQVCITYYQDVPAVEPGAPAERCVVQRQLWAPSLIIPSMRALFALLQETLAAGETRPIGPPWGVMHH